MRHGGPASRAVARLDQDIARAVGDRDAIVIAFSGGLASLIVAAIVRKRCDIRCRVVGTSHAADVEAALVAQTFLDYPVEVIQPAGPQALRVAQGLRRLAPVLSVPEILSLVPAALASEGQRPTPVITGLGLRARGATLHAVLQRWQPLSPGLRLRLDRSSRGPLRRMAEEVGLPDSFAQASPRRPIEGSGIGPVLRELARVRGTSLIRLVSGRS